MVALPVTYKCLLNVSGNISWVCEYVNVCPQGARGGGRKKNEVVQVSPVEGLQDVQDEVATSKLLLFYCYYGIRGTEKEENKAKLLISDTTCFLRLLMKVYCKKTTISLNLIEKK